MTMRASVCWLAGAVALSAVFFVELLPRWSSAAPGEGVAGDIDGDGSANISDAVYYLAWLFRGGPAPVPPDCPQDPAPAITVSGQSNCYDERGAEVSCESTQYPQQDAFHHRGCGGSGGTRWIDNGDGTVTDNCTRLMWQRVSGDTVPIVWSEALVRGDRLVLTRDGTWTTDPVEVATHGGVLYDDWRLPSIRELESLLDYGRTDPSVHPTFSIVPAGYWASTTNAGHLDEAWCVHFFEGETRPVPKGTTLHVAAVRSLP